MEDVVVSASANGEAVSEKQAKALQSEPVAATIVTAKQIENQQITQLEQVRKLVPSLSLKYLNIQNLTYNIRGIGNADGTQIGSAFSGAPIYVDGVYFARPGTAVVDIPDLVGVQVLKGPQGTSGGWDSTSGAVHLTTALPSFVAQQKFSVSYGSYNFIQLKATATGPIDGSDKAAFRITVFGTNRDGYITSTNSDFRYNDWKDKGIRGQLLLQPDNDLSLRFSFDYSHVNYNCCIAMTHGAITQFANGQPVPNNFFDRSARVGYVPSPFNGLERYSTDVGRWRAPTEATENAGVSAHVQYNWNGFTLSSITAYRYYAYHCNWRQNSVIDVDLVRRSCWNPEVNSLQQQLSVETPKGQPIEAKGGLFFLWEDFHSWNYLWYGGQAGDWFAGSTNPADLQFLRAAVNWSGNDSYYTVSTKSVAPYGQAVWHATPELDLTFGARYSFTARSGHTQGLTWGQPLDGLPLAERPAAAAVRAAFVAGGNPNFLQAASTGQGLVSGLFAAAYKFTPDITGYVTYGHGVRPAGPNVSPYPIPDGASPTIKPEQLDNYEVGVKSTLFDQRLLANFAAFWLDDRNYITTVAAPSSGGAVITYVANAPHVISRGFELDLRAQPIDGLNVYGSGAFLDAFYASFPSAPCPFEKSYLPTCDFTGSRIATTPRWAFATGGEYSRPLGIAEPFTEKPIVGFVGADYTWQSSVFSGSFGDNSNSAYSVIPAYGLLDVHLGVKAEDESWNLTGWIHNALDKHYFRTLAPVVFGLGPAGLVAGYVGDPLMAGFTLQVKL